MLRLLQVLESPRPSPRAAHSSPPRVPASITRAPSRRITRTLGRSASTKRSKRASCSGHAPLRSEKRELALMAPLRHELRRRRPFRRGSYAARDPLVYGQRPSLGARSRASLGRAQRRGLCDAVVFAAACRAPGGRGSDRARGPSAVQKNVASELSDDDCPDGYAAALRRDRGGGLSVLAEVYSVAAAISFICGIKTLEHRPGRVVIIEQRPAD